MSPLSMARLEIFLQAEKKRVMRHQEQEGVLCSFVGRPSEWSIFERCQASKTSSKQPSIRACDLAADTTQIEIKHNSSL